jgi:hypothetical protein
VSVALLEAGSSVPPAPGTQARYTGAILLRTRPKTYRKIVELLANPSWSITQIAKACKVTDRSIVAVREREAATIESRKAELVTMFSDVATVGVGRLQDTIGKASVRDAAIGSGVAVDKMLALLGQSPAVQIANVIMPSEADREERRALHDKLDAIAQRLNAQP